MWIPSQVNVDESDRSGELYRMADANGKKCEQVLPRNHQDLNGSPQPNTQECTFDKASTRDIQYNNTTWQEDA